MLGPLSFLTCINEVTEKLKCDCLSYAGDTSFFDTVDDPITSSLNLNNHLSEIEVIVCLFSINLVLINFYSHCNLAAHCNSLTYAI